MRHKPYNTACCLLLLPILGNHAAAQPASNVAPNPPADLLLIHGHIYTSNPTQPWAQALAIRGARIVAVGSDPEVQALRGPRTRVIDLTGRMAMPGIIDSHIHFLDGSLSLDQFALDNVYTLEEIQARVRDYAAAHPDRQWLLGRGWLYDVFKPSGLPTRQLLDAIVPDRPVVVECYDGHSVWVNSKALALAGITKDTPDVNQGGVVVGMVVRDPNTGEPAGVLKEEAMGLVRKLFCKVPDHWLGLCQQNVLLKGILDGYRLRRPVRDDFALVDTAGELVQAPTIAAEVVFECGQIHTSQISHSLYSKFPQLLSCNFADSRQPPNRQRQKKRIYVLGLDDKEPIRFAPVGGEFC